MNNDKEFLDTHTSYPEKCVVNSVPVMSLRDNFASQVIQGFINRNGTQIHCDAKDWAILAYEIADEMMEARKSD
jgi:hypothetical protein